MYTPRLYPYCFNFFNWISQYRIPRSKITFIGLEIFFCFDKYDWISQYHDITISHWKITHTSSGKWFIALIIMMEYHNITISHQKIINTGSKNLLNSLELWISCNNIKISQYHNITCHVILWYSIRTIWIEYHNITSNVILWYWIIFLSIWLNIKISQYHVLK